MKAGLVADIVVAIIILINLLVCTRMGLVRCVLKFFSTILALITAMLTVTPLTNFFDSKFHWVDAVEKWNVPFISAETLLKLLIGIAVFVIVRLIHRPYPRYSLRGFRSFGRIDFGFHVNQPTRLGKQLIINRRCGWLLRLSLVRILPRSLIQLTWRNLCHSRSINTKVLTEFNFKPPTYLLTKQSYLQLKCK